MRSLVSAFLVLFVVHGLESTESTSAERTKCNQDCLNLGFSAGYFKDKQCWCYDAGTATLKNLAKLKPSKLHVTPKDGSKCNRTCIKLGLDGGFFKDGHCWCYGNEKIEEAAKEITKCNQECMDFGMSGGFRHNGHCWCFGDNQTGKAFTKVSVEQNHYRFQVIPIKNADCNKECMKAGMNGGFVKNGQCVCFELEPSGDAPVWTLPSKPKTITPIAFHVASPVKIPDAIRDCNADCVKLGMSGGYFKDGQCWCYHLEVSGDATLHALSELESPKPSASRSPLRWKHTANHIEIRNCHKDCVKNGWTGGYLKDGQCWCYHLEVSGDATLQALPESGKRSSPSHSQPLGKPVVIPDCNNECIKVGMSGGYFKNGECWCYELEASGDATLKPLADIQSPSIEA